MTQTHRKGMHAEEIKAALKMRFGSLAAFAVQLGRNEGAVMRVETLERDLKATLQRIETSLAVVSEGGRKTEQMVAVIVRGHMERKL
ncbi:MAG: hypothetical protein ABF979_14520 [Gluconobacter sp.]|uniref:Uncharacterized protein n=1 Tax=Acetobacter aceti TaxID=435 RepID=A0A1U9KDL0_ACEAC|nr:hypothetical protein [Acetobacter aceti]AQS83880.1 hypothetical protein A0U92_02835 [Acetobacter aceti]